MAEQSPRTSARPCREPDVDALERVLPTGPNRFHAARFRRQGGGSSTFLVAYAGAVIVGSGEVLWSGAKEPEVRDLFPDCPEINGLGVVPERQGRGVGTAIIRGGRGTRGRAGPAADRDGRRRRERPGRGALPAPRLCRPGCVYLDRYRYLDERGAPHDVADPCRFLVKEL